MNTAVRTFAGNFTKTREVTSPFGELTDLLRSKYFMIVASLIAAIFISALSIVYIQNDNRELFSQLQSLQKNRDALHVEWGQLLLEESTWSTQARVQRIAEQRLHMTMPKQKNIVIVQE